MEFMIGYATLILVIWPSLYLKVMAFELTLLHTNDVHARYEQFNEYGTNCSPDEAARRGTCFGGVARRATMLKKIRSEHNNVIFLDGGDQFQGTLWFYYHQGLAAAYYMQLLGYDAMVRNCNKKINKHRNKGRNNYVTRMKNEIHYFRSIHYNQITVKLIK